MTKENTESKMYIYALAILLAGATETIRNLNLEVSDFNNSSHKRDVARRISNNQYWIRPFESIDTLKTGIERYIKEVFGDDPDQYAICDLAWITQIEGELLNSNNKMRTEILKKMESRLDDCRLMLDGSCPKKKAIK